MPKESEDNNPWKKHLNSPRVKAAMAKAEREAPVAHSAPQTEGMRLVEGRRFNRSERRRTEKVLGKVKAKMQLPGNFKVNNEGVFYTYPGESGTTIKICGLLEIIAETRDENGDSWGLWLEWKDGDGRLHRWAMPMSMLAADGADIRRYLLDKGLYVASSNSARALLLEFLGQTKVEARAFAVSKLGWTNGVFVLPNRTIGDSEEKRVIYQVEGRPDHRYQSKGELCAWQRAVAKYAVGNSRLALAISAGFVGPLLSLLDEEGGGVHFRGPSSIGKSTALIVGASVWGPAEFVRQWRSTANGLEGACVLHNETLLCLDKLAQLDSSEAGSVAYMIANGMGKARASRSGSLRAPAQWKVIFLSSGEIRLSDLAERDNRRARNSSAGQDIRILDCEADAGEGLGLFETIHDAPSAEALARMLKEGVSQNHSVAGTEFVKRIADDTDSLTTDLKGEINAFVAENAAADSSGQVKRAARRFGLIAAAGELATRLDVLPWDEREATNACKAIFNEWLASRGGDGSGEERDAIARVRAFIKQHGSSRFEAIEADHEPRIINRAGFWREGEGGREYLFLPQTWRTEVCAGLDAPRVSRILGEHGMLQKDTEGKNSISVSLPGLGKTRCYVVNNKIFELDDTNESRADLTVAK